MEYEHDNSSISLFIITDPKYMLVWNENLCYHNEMKFSDKQDKQRKY